MKSGKNEIQKIDDVGKDVTKIHCSISYPRFRLAEKYRNRLQQQNRSTDHTIGRP